MKPLFGTLLLALLGVMSAARAERPLNILLLYADDVRLDSLGVAGNPIIKTPNLDKLAAEGEFFRANCVTTSVCGVSRACLYTGQWMSRHGCRRMKPWKTPWSESFPEQLRAAGYYVVLVGQWHNGPAPVEHFDFGRFYHGKHWYPTEDGGRIHVTQRNENDAMEFFKTRPRDRPFCLTVSFCAPHAVDSAPEQYFPQPESMKLYTDVEVPVPENATGASWKRLPDFFNEKNVGRERWHWRYDTPKKYQAMMKNYYRLISGVDATCGRLLAELKRQGVLDNTLVIFTSDNGYFQSEHGLAGKWYAHQESIHVPLIICDPRMPRDKRGGVSDDFTLSVDLAPTILTAAGVEPPRVMQGRDIAPLYLAAEKPEWRSEFFYEFPGTPIRIPGVEALVRKDWKYMYWYDHDFEQLFDLKNDPREEHDLAADPRQAGKLKEMRERFRKLKEEAK